TRLDSAVDGLASMVAAMCGFPEGSAADGLVRDVIGHWAVATGLLEGPTIHREDFLETFDLEFPRRRLDVVIRPPRAAVGNTATPMRADLDAAARDLDDLRADIAAAKATMVTGDHPPGSAVRARRAARAAFPAKDVDGLLLAETDRRAAAAIHLHS